MQLHANLDIFAQTGFSGMICFLVPPQHLEQAQEPQQLRRIAKKVRMEIFLVTGLLRKILALQDIIVNQVIDYVVIQEKEPPLLHRHLAHNALTTRNASLGRIETLKTNINAQLDITISILRAFA